MVESWPCTLFILSTYPVNLTACHGSQGVQEVAARTSSIVNKAYSTLLNPFARAEYILELNNIEIGESDNVDDPELIMEIMEAREGLDSAESQDEVERIRAENAGKASVVQFFEPHASVYQRKYKRYFLAYLQLSLLKTGRRSKATLSS